MCTRFTLNAKQLNDFGPTPINCGNCFKWTGHRCGLERVFRTRTPVDIYAYKNQLLESMRTGDVLVMLTDDDVLRVIFERYPVEVVN